MLPLKGEGEATRCANGAHIPEEAIEPFVVPQLENGEERIRDGGHTSDIVDSQAVSCACLVLGRDGEVANVRAAVLASVDPGDRLVGGPLVDEQVWVVDDVE